MLLYFFINFLLLVLLIVYSIYDIITMGAQYIGKAVNGLHKNVLLGQMTISNTRSK